VYDSVEDFPLVGVIEDDVAQFLAVDRAGVPVSSSECIRLELELEGPEGVTNNVPKALTTCLCSRVPGSTTRLAITSASMIGMP